MSYFILPYWAYVLLGFVVIAVIGMAVILGSLLWDYFHRERRRWVLGMSHFINERRKAQTGGKQ